MHPNADHRTALAPSRTQMVSDAIQNGSAAAQPDPATALGATLITGHILSDLERRLSKAEETTFGPRPEGKNQSTADPSGLLAHGRNNVERLAAAAQRVNELLSAIGV